MKMLGLDVTDISKMHLQTLSEKHLTLIKFCGKILL